MDRKRILVWVKSGAMLAIFGVMFFALSRMVSAYSFAQIAGALGQLSFGFVASAIGLVAVQQGFLVIRERLAVGYAKRELGLARVALASVVARPLSTLGFSSLTGVGLRLHIYAGWGITAGDVAEISVYDNAVFLVGTASQFGLAFTLLPIPARLAGWIPAPLVRAIGIACIALVIGYIAWSRRGRDLHVRKLAIPAPTPRQLLGQIFLPVVDLVLTAMIVQLCLPDGLGLSYFDVVIVCLVASVASSISQLPAGIGVLEGTTLLFVDGSDAAPSVIAGLFVWRLLTNLLPILVSAILLVILEIRRRAPAGPPHPHTVTTATVLAALTFVVAALVMITSASPFGDRLGELGQVVSIATGTGMLFVARGLEHGSKRAWQVALGLVAVRAAVAFAVQPAIYVVGVLAVVGALLALSRRVFHVEHPPLPPSPRWWIAAGMVLWVTAWVAYFANGRAFTPLVYEELGATLGVAAIAVVAAALHRRRLAH